MSYQPNIAIHPGRTILELLSREGMTQKSLSERTGTSEKHLSQIINGEASITVETALLLENALGGSASFWTNLEKNFQETRARIERIPLLRRECSFLPNYPYGELAKMGCVEPTSSREKRVENLWKFFGVNSLSYVPTTEQIAFRKTGNSGVRSEAIAAWLRCGELESRKQRLGEFSEGALRSSLDDLRKCSLLDPGKYSVAIVRLLNDAGVALVCIPHFRSTGVSGAVRWINDRPVIQLSLYYACADIFWFNLFHEIGHLLLHGKKGKFLEFDDKDLAFSKSKEQEADTFAGDALISPKRYARFIAEPITRPRIVRFAKYLNIHPGIVAGRLCHDKLIEWRTVSALRPRLTFDHR